jgi:hypothetical protein
MHDKASQTYPQSTRYHCIKEGRAYHHTCCDYVNLELTMAVADSTFLNRIDPVVS